MNHKLNNSYQYISSETLKSFKWYQFQTIHIFCMLLGLVQESAIQIWMIQICDTFHDQLVAVCF